MKTNLILFFMLLFFSCSPEEQEKIDGLNINPPSWIQGTWKSKMEETRKLNLRFTEKNFFETEEGEIEINVMAPYFILLGLGDDVSVEEFITMNSYAIKISTIHSNKWYKFTRISSEELSWDNAPPFNESEVYERTN